jgi:MoaA/NifB/PqqE/SkfB family radical SAM enzyme
MMTNWILHQDQPQQDAQRGFQQRHDGALPPTTMVISPTKACNLHCTGCYASGPGGARLEWDVFNRIIEEAKSEWGMRFFTISGGEPLAYHTAGRDLLDVTSAHDDCFFMMYTNGTLIDEEMAQRMAAGGNLTPAISVEGFEQRTDKRRGAGVFKRILAAMHNLREARVPFGISLTATRHNAEEILSDEFIDFFFEEQQAVYGWLFQYMPIGRSYTLDLLVTPEQRLWMWRRTWEIVRERGFMLADFWNSGTASTGCIAAARAGGYLYIDWNGKVMPCVFVPYAAGNIHEIYAAGGTLDDAYDLPYLAAIRQWQWDYGYGCQHPDEHGNWLLPCALRDNYRNGRGLIDEHRPKPEDEAAAEALIDGGYYEGMMAYDEALRQVFDPVWQEEYLGHGRD